MERHSDCTSSLFQDEDRRMAGVQARKEEEKKRESHKQTIHKVPARCDLHLFVFVCLDLHFDYVTNTRNGLHLRE